VNLPQLTACIGDSLKNANHNLLTSLIKRLKKVKETETAYSVFLIFDLEAREIRFCLNKELSESCVDKYFYFGNNSAASSQYYLARETKSLNYLLTSVLSDLYSMLGKYNMPIGELASIIKRMESSGLIQLAPKKGDGRVNLGEFSIVKGNDKLNVAFDNKALTINGHNYGFEAVIRLFINDDNKKNRYVLVIPVVKLENGEEIILSTHPEYLELVRQANNLGDEPQTGKDGGRVCYVCGSKKTGVSSDYSAKFSRSGINKIFTTTTINTSPYLQNNNYDQIYSMCTSCYQKLLHGEKIITEQFRSRIAGEDVFIIPEGLTASFNYNFLFRLKNGVDLTFNTNIANKWLDDLEGAVDFDQVQLYSLNFLFYRTDGNSFSILETIEDVPTLRFVKVMRILAEKTFDMEHQLREFSIGQIYRIIPVRTNKKGEQLDIGNVLSLYKALLLGEQIRSAALINYAADALDKGMRQLNKDKADNYQNMGLRYYAGGREDFFIKRIIMSYLVLIETCQQLNILDKPVFDFNGEGANHLDKINTASEKVNVSIEAMEKFLDDRKFDKEARALFYLGVLINRVAIAQLEKEHKKKPVLKKIQFQGMKSKEVYRLYLDVLEKLQQYDRFSLFAEAVLNRLHYYGSFNHTEMLGERENVFFIMSGYAYLVGTKTPDITKGEEDVMADSIEESDHNETPIS
jgi:CRISPR-associated protein Csh1